MFTIWKTTFWWSAIWQSKMWRRMPVFALLWKKMLLYRIFEYDCEPISSCLYWKASPIRTTYSRNMRWSSLIQLWVDIYINMIRPLTFLLRVSFLITDGAVASTSSSKLCTHHVFIHIAVTATLSLTHPLPLPLSHYHSFSLILTVSLTHSHSLSLILTLSLPFSLSLAHSHSLSLIITLSHSF
jgi:hypothetical protein